jgi:hypothetical protein
MDRIEKSPSTLWSAMFTLIAYHDGHIRHWIVGPSLANLVRYARGFTRDTRADWFCESVVVSRGDSPEPVAADVVAVVVLGQVHRPEGVRHV